jgi:predicted aspartyl protease
LVSNVYDKADEGFNKLILAYEALRKLGGAKLDDPELVKYSNTLLIDNVAQFNATIKSIEAELNTVASSIKK